jgi:hypothetical protein
MRGPIQSSLTLGHRGVSAQKPLLLKTELVKTPVGLPNKSFLLLFFKKAVLFLA